MRHPPLAYRLCVRCARAVPLEALETFCINDGSPLLSGCPCCAATIPSPYARYCPRCGACYADAASGIAPASGAPSSGAPSADAGGTPRSTGATPLPSAPPSAPPFPSPLRASRLPEDDPSLEGDPC